MLPDQKSNGVTCSHLCFDVLGRRTYCCSVSLLRRKPYVRDWLEPTISDSQLSSQIRKSSMERIEGFQNEFRFLSNFESVRVVLDGVTYPSVEHAYQAAKSLDVNERIIIQKAKGPGHAKRLGKIMDCRSDWDDVKERIMMDLCIQKFAQEPFRTLLLETGDAYIEETNTWKDTHWGVCDGKGKNRMGHILMEIRQYLKEIK